MLLSLIIPVFNEAESLPLLAAALTRLTPSLDCACEIVLVDDGSQDGSFEILEGLAAADPRIKVIHFSRNFGHQAAITAGLDFVSGDAAVILDADLQDPPELIPRMVELYREGFDVVSAQRVSRDSDSFFKTFSARLFYTVMRNTVDKRIQPEVGDFRLLSRPVIDAIREFREQHRFMRGLIAWLGFKEALLPFHRQARVAGETKYPLGKMIRFAWTAISSFSALPLRLTIAAGLFFTLAGLCYLAYALFQALVLKSVVWGWTSLVCLQVIFSGITLLAIGMVGDYVARIYEEAKGRPLYVVARARNVDPALWRPAASRAATLTAAAGRPLQSNVPSPEPPYSPRSDLSRR